MWGVIEGLVPHHGEETPAMTGMSRRDERGAGGTARGSWSRTRRLVPLLAWRRDPTGEETPTCMLARPAVLEKGRQPGKKRQGKKCGHSAWARHEASPGPSKRPQPATNASTTKKAYHAGRTRRPKGWRALTGVEAHIAKSEDRVHLAVSSGTSDGKSEAAKGGGRQREGGGKGKAGVVGDGVWM